MQKVLSVVAALAMIGATVLTGTTKAEAAPDVITPTEAQQAAKAGTPDHYSPKDGVYFNNPYGTTRPEVFGILTEVTRAINSVPRGGRIQLAVYSFTRDDTAQAVLNAWKRGVAVQILVDSHSNEYAATKLLRKKLGKDRKKKNFLVWCKQSCMSSKESLMHAKSYTFTSVGKSKYVTMIGSGNISTSPTSQAWNNMVTMANNKAMYDFNVTYFKEMLKDKSRSFYHTRESGAYKAYTFPRKWSKDSDSMMTILNGVNCASAPAPGYGYKGRTVVKVGMYAWTNGRKNLAKKLVDLKRKGCYVEVTYSGERVEHSITKTLLTKTKRGKIPIYNARLKTTYDTPYMHHKNVLINGVWYGNRANKAVYAGTANFTNNTQRECNEIMLRIGRTDFYNKFDANYNLVRSPKYAKKVTSTKGLMPYLGDSASDGDSGNDFQLLGD